MTSILRVRDADGKVSDIPAIRGKSAYQYAVEGGYTGSEAAFSAKMAQEYIPKNQGAANVGKILVVGTDGNLTLADLPEGGAGGDVVGTLDESNNILLSGNLADGTYTLKYEYEDGTVADVGSIVVGEIPVEPTFTNFIEYNATNGVGATSADQVDWNLWCNDARIGSSGDWRAPNATYPNSAVTNYIAVQPNDIIYWEDMHVYDVFCCVYNSGKTALKCSRLASTGTLITEGMIKDLSTLDATTKSGNLTIAGSNVAYIKFTITKSDDCPFENSVVKIKRNGEWL